MSSTIAPPTKQRALRKNDHGPLTSLRILKNICWRKENLRFSVLLRSSGKKLFQNLSKPYFSLCSSGYSLPLLLPHSLRGNNKLNLFNI